MLEHKILGVRSEYAFLADLFSLKTNLTSWHSREAIVTLKGNSDELSGPLIPRLSLPSL